MYMLYYINMVFHTLYKSQQGVLYDHLTCLELAFWNGYFKIRLVNQKILLQIQIKQILLILLTRYPIRGDDTVMDSGAEAMINPTM